jgi:hypothetical protein
VRVIYRKIRYFEGKDYIKVFQCGVAAELLICHNLSSEIPAESWASGGEIPNGMEKTTLNNESNV